jgi:large subunit ribosomal protein L6
MSRIGKKPVDLPDGISAKVANGTIVVKGKSGELSQAIHPAITVKIDEAAKKIVVTRPDDSRSSRALHGLMRALINNMVQGLVTPFVKKLEIQGVGYQASLAGKFLTLQVGFANQIKLEVPANVKVTCPDATHIIMESSNKQAVGQFAAVVRKVRPPEPYKGKGIRYDGEKVRRKAGKAMAGK